MSNIEIIRVGEREKIMMMKKHIIIPIELEGKRLEEDKDWIFV